MITKPKHHKSILCNVVYPRKIAFISLDFEDICAIRIIFARKTRNFSAVKKHVDKETLRNAFLYKGSMKFLYNLVD